MDDIFFVGGGEALRDLHGVVGGFTRQERAGFKFGAERDAFEKFGDQKRRVVLLADVVGGQDIGMVEGGHGAGFLFEAAEPVGISGKRFGQDF